MNVPLSVLGLIAAARILAPAKSGARVSLDLPGAALIAGGLAFVTLALSFSQEWSRARVLSCLVVEIVSLVVTGVGQGLFQSPNARAFMNASPPGDHGEASSLYATARVVGQSLSVALAGTVFAALGGASAGHALVLAGTGSAAAGDIVVLQHTFVTGFRGTLLVCAAIASVGIVAALVRGVEHRAGAPPSPPSASNHPKREFRGGELRCAHATRSLSRPRS